MKQSKHTPGPWSYAIEGDEITINCGDIYGAATMPQDNEDFPKYEQAANARLIAASPEMYDFILERAQAGDKEAQSIISDIVGQ